MTLVELAAIVAAVLMVGVAAFQVALALGLPLGDATMGGRAATVDGVLEPRYRVIALVSAVALIVAAWIVLARAGLLPISMGDSALALSTWVVAGFLVLNTVTNLSGKQRLESRGMASITLVSAVLVGYVAFAAP
jgi:hypothetical protein